MRHKNQSLNDRFRLCLDTCHIFAAGYDLSKESTILLYLEALEELIGIRYVGLIHLNDSKNTQGSHVDRHENIGIGNVGKEGIMIFAKYFKNINVPIILETPNEKLMQDLLMLLEI